jgi:hypothetical protein
MSHIIDVTDFTNQDTVFRVLGEMRNHGTCYSLVQDGVEVAKVVPVAKRNYNDDKVSDEVTKKRWEAEARADILSKKIAEAWSTNETALEAIQNDRR